MIDTMVCVENSDSRGTGAEGRGEGSGHGPGSQTTSTMPGTTGRRAQVCSHGTDHGRGVAAGLTAVSSVETQMDGPSPAQARFTPVRDSSLRRASTWGLWFQ